MTFELDLARIEKLAAEIILQRGEVDWPERDVQGDAALLVLLVKALVDDVHRLTQQIKPRDLCPLCAGCTWGRPPENADGGWDYTRRKCHRCGTIRPEPEDPSL